MSSLDVSLFEFHGLQSSFRCGYCRQENTGKSDHGMSTPQMTVDVYQDLLDRGWRRSGTYVYKPVMKDTCCPQYTIRCRAAELVLSKSQKKVIRQLNHFLATGVKSKMKTMDRNVPNAGGPGSGCGSERVEDQNTAAKSVASGQLRGKDIRRIKKLERLKKKGIDPSVNQAVRRKSLETRLSEGVDPKSKGDSSPVHRLEARLVRSHPRSGKFDESFTESHAVYAAYQIAIHKDAPSKPVVSQFMRFLCTSPLAERPMSSLKLVSNDGGVLSNLDQSQSSFELFQLYQMSVHGDTADECDENAYGGFLLVTPLVNKAEQLNEHPGYGSFHQQYFLDDKLIAVGVLDILPRSISSKYLFFHPDYQFLNLGTYTALREIALVRQLMKISPDLQYYYMGYYIHNCQKMRYKGNFSPSDLLCPETYKWCPIERCSPKLDEAKYSRFDETGAVDEDGNCDLDCTGILYHRKAITWRDYVAAVCGRGRPPPESAEVQTYCQLVGSNVARKALLYRPS